VLIVGNNNTNYKDIIMPKAKDMTGIKINRLTFKKYLRTEKKGRVWLLECECGNFIELPIGPVQSNGTRSCGCLNFERWNRNLLNKPEKSTEEIAYGRVIGYYKVECKNKKRVWNLSYEDSVKLFQGNCFYCGVQPSNTYKGRRLCDYDIYYNGIDRIDNLKDYTTNNVVSCCKKCNKIKSDRKKEDFEKWIFDVYKNMSLKEVDINATIT